MNKQNYDVSCCLPGSRRIWTLLSLKCMYHAYAWCQVYTFGQSCLQLLNGLHADHAEKSER